MRMLLCAAFFTLHASLFTACSEADDTVEEYANWQEKNETYFEQQYEVHAFSSSTLQFVLKNYTLGDEVSVAQAAHTSCILVDVLESGTDTSASPLYTDKVKVHYSGRLLPSASYPNGYTFDSSYTGTLDDETSSPVEFSVNGLVPGFMTALQHMHRSDYWRVTIPYQLGYGTAGSGSIPAYSTLIFDIKLVDFYQDED
mgnify:CR=1 FL=1